MELDDFDLSEEVLDSLEKDALRQISRHNSLEKDVRDADHHTQISEAEEAIPEELLTHKGNLDAESQLYWAIPREGITKDALQKKLGPSIYRVGIQQALKNKSKWLILENKSDLVRRKTSAQMGRPNHASKRKRAATDLTRENLRRGDAKGKPVVTFDEMLEGLPTYLLFESCTGYALLLAHGLHEFGDSYEAVEKYTNRFDEVFKLIAFYPFQSADEAGNQIDAIYNGVVTEQLKNFLVLNLPKPLEGGKPSFALGVADPFMVNQIVAKYKIAFACMSGIFYHDVMRGVRMHIDKIIDGMKPGDFDKAQLDLARRFSRQRLNSTYSGKEVQKKKKKKRAK